jgi:hypothetical protein
VYNVSELLEADGVAVGADRVARIPQQGNYGYGIIRASIMGPAGTFVIYKGFIAPNCVVTRVLTPGVNDAQFSPYERISRGVDVIGVWVGGATYAGVTRLTITTDGGYL